MHHLGLEFPIVSIGFCKLTRGTEISAILTGLDSLPDLLRSLIFHERFLRVAEPDASSIALLLRSVFVSGFASEDNTEVIPHQCLEFWSCCLVRDAMHRNEDDKKEKECRKKNSRIAVHSLLYVWI